MLAINIQKRHFSKKVVITSPIFYVNAKPHIGHLYTAVLCDAMKRYHKLNGDEVLFSTGTDEHGLKIQKRALEADIPAYNFCTKNAKFFLTLFKKASIDYDRFIRTTDDSHKAAVANYWQLLQSKGHIKEGSHSGFYSVNEESFISEKDLVKDINGYLCTEAGEKVEEIQEKNYVFEITPEIRQAIKEWAIKPQSIVPEGIRTKIMLEFEQRKAEISVSRPTERISWGIKVPGDESQTVYVWLDALVNYLTVTGYP
jgi:methionyl-tRNA synthetase